MRPSDLTGPLSLFQATDSQDEKDLALLLESLNEACDNPLDRELLHRTFARSYPEFRDQMERIDDSAPKDKRTVKREPEDMIEEILNTVRRMERREPTALGRRSESPVLVRRPAVRELDEEPWSDAELSTIRETLTAERDRLGQELDALVSAETDAIRGISDAVGENQAQTDSERLNQREEELTLLSNIRETMRLTEHGLGRLADGTYGNCESCGRPIGKARLQAFPRANLCVTCKQREERP
jgi:DnaK suppressor protein